jgi:hypothetical protein
MTYTGLRNFQHEFSHDRIKLFNRSFKYLKDLVLLKEFN